jgi:hypothetical protein
MNKQKFKALFKFSVSKYFTNKWFAIINVLLLVSMLIGINFSSITKLISPKEDQKYDIYFNDSSDLVVSKLPESLLTDEVFNININKAYSYTAETIKKNDIIFNISGDNEQIFKTEIISKEGISAPIMNKITSALYDIRNDLFSEKYGVEKEKITLFQSELKIDRKMIAVDSDNATTKSMLILFSAAASYFLYVMVFSRISSEVSQEKQSKSSEYVLTAVSEKDYLLSKVLSHAFIMFIQGVLIACYYVFSTSILSLTKMATTDINLKAALTSSGISSEILFYILILIFYDVLNLILLSIIQATMAARTSSSTEAGNSVSITTFIASMLFIFCTTLSPYQKISPVLHILSTLPILSRLFNTFVYYNESDQHYCIFNINYSTSYFDSACI